LLGDIGSWRLPKWVFATQERGRNGTLRRKTLQNLAAVSIRRHVKVKSSHQSASAKIDWQFDRQQTRRKFGYKKPSCKRSNT
jgi:hypothetical protein